MPYHKNQPLWPKKSSNALSLFSPIFSREISIRLFIFKKLPPPVPPTLPPTLPMTLNETPWLFAIDSALLRSFLSRLTIILDWLSPKRRASGLILPAENSTAAPTPPSGVRHDSKRQTAAPPSETSCADLIIPFAMAFLQAS